MSTQLDTYMEYQTSPNYWFNITNQNPFDGAQLVDPNQSLLPAFSYPADHNLMVSSHFKTIKSNALSAPSRQIYQSLSNQVTGGPDGLKIYAITFYDLCDIYNQTIQSASQSSSVLAFLQELIARIANSYYWQLGLNGDPTVLLPNAKTPINLNDNWQNFRIVGWIDA